MRARIKQLEKKVERLEQMIQGPILIDFKKMTDTAKSPKYAHYGDSGMDVFVDDESVTIKPGERALIHTGLKVQFISEGVELQVRPKSGLALEYGLTVLNTPGTIDSNYRGEICVIVINHGKSAFRFHYGDKVAQLVPCRVLQQEQLSLSLEVEEERWTSRGEGGFGSTGMKRFFKYK